MMNAAYASGGSAAPAEISGALNAEIVLIPAACMMIGSLAVLCLRVSERVQACFQNLSAGILIAAIGNELFPLMNNGVEGATTPPTQQESILGICGGFVIGVCFMFGIDAAVDCISGDDDDDDDAGGEDMEAGLLNDAAGNDDEQLPSLAWYKQFAPVSRLRQKQPEVEKNVQLLTQAIENGSDICAVDEVVHRLSFFVDSAQRSLSPKKELDAAAKAKLREHAKELQDDYAALQTATTAKEARASLHKISEHLDHLHEDHIETRFKRWAPVSPPPAEGDLSEEIPIATLFAVAVDASVDGVLIGLALAADKTAGLSMAIATCIEMAFLGLSFSATVQNATRSTAKHILCVSIPPLCLFGCGILGHAAGAALQSSQGLFIGFISFAIVALLFLVTQELLTEAREVAGETFYINVMFFVGLLGGMMLDKVIG